MVGSFTPYHTIPANPREPSSTALEGADRSRYSRDGTLYVSQDPPHLIWADRYGPQRVADDTDIPREARRVPLTVARYTHRAAKGLYVGIGADGPAVPWEGSCAYFLDGDNIRLVPAGDGGVLVIGGRAPLTSCDMAACTAVGCEGEGHPTFMLPKLLNGVMTANNAESSLTDEEVAEVVSVWIYTAMLDKPTKPLLVFTGPAGSAKTSSARAILRLLDGPAANVNSLPKGPQDLEVVASQRRFLVLDNVDSEGKVWLLDTLAAVATGVRCESRKLYSNGDLATLDVRTALILTSMDMPFNRADVADRSIVLERRRLSEFLPESTLEVRVDRRREVFWWFLLHDLNHLIRLEREKPVAPSVLRMADYAAVGCLVWGDRSNQILRRIGRSQARMALRDDSIVAALVEQVRSEGLLRGKAGEIRDLLQPLGRELPAEARTGKRLGNHLRRIAPAARQIGLEITWEADSHANANIYTVRWLGDGTTG